MEFLSRLPDGGGVREVGLGVKESVEWESGTHQKNCLHPMPDGHQGQAVSAFLN